MFVQLLAISPLQIVDLLLELLFQFVPRLFCRLQLVQQSPPPRLCPFPLMSLTQLLPLLFVPPSLLLPLLLVAPLQLLPLLLVPTSLLLCLLMEMLFLLLLLSCCANLVRLRRVWNATCPEWVTGRDETAHDPGTQRMRATRTDGARGSIPTDQVSVVAQDKTTGFPSCKCKT